MYKFHPYQSNEAYHYEYADGGEITIFDFIHCRVQITLAGPGSDIYEFWVYAYEEPILTWFTDLPHIIEVLHWANKLSKVKMKYVYKFTTGRDPKCFYCGLAGLNIQDSFAGPISNLVLLYITRSHKEICYNCIEKKEQTDPVFALGLEGSTE